MEYKLGVRYIYWYTVYILVYGIYWYTVEYKLGARYIYWYTVNRKRYTILAQVNTSIYVGIRWYIYILGIRYGIYIYIGIQYTIRAQGGTSIYVGTRWYINWVYGIQYVLRVAPVYMLVYCGI